MTSPLVKTIFATDLINELGRSLNYKPPRRFKSWINDSNPHRSLILNRGFKIWISYRQFSDRAQIYLIRSPAEGKVNFYDKKWSPILIDIKIFVSPDSSTFSLLIQDNTINMGIQWRIRFRLCYELALQYMISKVIILLCLLEFILWKR